MTSRVLTWALLAGAALLMAGSGSATAFPPDVTTVATLARETHFHGIAVDRGDPSRLYLATHHGLYVAKPDGSAERISETRDDFMGFTPHPTDPLRLYASGHPVQGGNLGFIVSRDGGRSWSKLSDGLDGPVDFHQMDVSKADPQIIYGVYGTLQRSADGGRSWTRVGPPPEGLIAIAASAASTEILYAATQTGLLRSTDGGRSWTAAYPRPLPTTMVHVAPAGDVYTFVVGRGLVRATEARLEWNTVSTAFGENYVLYLAVSPESPQTFYAVTMHPQTHAQDILRSQDGGASWASLTEPEREGVNWRGGG